MGKPKDKPGVERPIPFIREDFWRGRQFSSLEENNAGLETWSLGVAGQRVQGTTRQRPLAVFRLVELPASVSVASTVVVDSQGHLLKATNPNAGAAHLSL